jgi:hypothetical protein
LPLSQIGEVVVVQFDDERYTGEASVIVSVEASSAGTRTFLRLSGTGPLEGWSDS